MDGVHPYKKNRRSTQVGGKIMSLFWHFEAEVQLPQEEVAWECMDLELREEISTGNINLCQ